MSPPIPTPTPSLWLPFFLTLPVPLQVPLPHALSEVSNSHLTTAVTLISRHQQQQALPPQGTGVISEVSASVAGLAPVSVTSLLPPLWPLAAPCQVHPPGPWGGGQVWNPLEPGLGVQLWATALPPPRPPYPLQELEA